MTAKEANYEHDNSSTTRRSEWPADGGESPARNQSSQASTAITPTAHRSDGVDQRRPITTHSDGQPTQIPQQLEPYDASWELTLTRTSPLPTVAEFAGYDRVLPGAADRILKMAENNQRAIIVNNDRDSQAENWALKAATFGGTFLPWFCLAGAGVLALLGHDIAAIVGTVLGAASGGVQIANEVINRHKP